MKRSTILNQIGVLFVTCLFIFLSSQIAWATTYYLDFSTGVDSNNGTSTTTPWKHAPGMNGWTGSATLSNGDTVILKGGVTWSYAGVNDLWTLPANITIQGGQRLETPWGTGLPIIASNGATGSVTGIVVGNHSNVTIDGIKIYNTENSPSGGSGISLAIVNTVEIKNCVLDHTGDQSIKGAGGGSAHILIHDNTFSNVGRLFISVDDSTNVDDIQIYNNTFLGVGSWPGGYNGVHGDGIMIGSACTAANTCLTNLKIHHNKFAGDWASGATALIFLQNGTGQGSTQYGGNHVQIYDNQFAIDSDGLLGAYIYLWSLWNDVKIYNNTTGGYLGGANPVPHGIAIVHASTSVDMKNNILSGCTNGITNSSGISATILSLTADYNFYSSDMTRFLNGWAGTNADCRNISDCQASPFNQEAHGVAGDPKFITAPTGSNSGNWHLQNSSPAKTGGVNLGAPYTTDLDGVVGSSRIGAYEYGAGSGVTQSTLLVTSANGTVTSSPSGINCGSTCSANYDSGKSVTLTASPNSGYTFTGWSGGGCSGTGTCTVTMNAATSVTATFATTAYNLTVTKPGTGTGTVTGSDALINCGSTCSVNYASGKSVTMAASATSGSTFSGWSGGGCSGTGTCTVTMTAATSVTATFIPVYNLAVAKSVTAAGNVTSSDGTINCGSTCSANYNPGKSVTSTASPNSGYTFTGWSGGGCSGTGSCTVTMDAAKSVTASFATTQYNLHVIKLAGGKGVTGSDGLINWGKGQVTGSDGLINCGSTCSVNYASGTSVTLTALANRASIFAGWAGACSGTGTCTVSMTEVKSVTAIFLLKR